MKKPTGYIFKRNGIYWLRWDRYGKRFARTLGTRDKREAREAAERIMAPFKTADEADTLAAIKARLEATQQTAEQLAEESNPPLSMRDAWAAYLESEIRPRRAGPLTLTDYEGQLSAFTNWMKQRKPEAVALREVTAEDAAAYVRHLGKQGLSGNRINKAIAFLKTLFRVLAKPGRLTVNPFGEIARREQMPHTKRPFTIEELKRIIEAAKGEMKTLFMIGTFTGLRLADAATLRRDETDLARKIIRRIPRKTARTGKAVIVGIPTILAAHLGTLPRQGQFIMPEVAALYERNPRALVNRIQDHLEKCGIETTKPGTGPRAVVVAGFHSLRHTFVSLHAAAGTSQAVMMKLAGHGSPVMSELYTHIDESTALSAAAALPAILGEAKPVKALPAAHTVNADEVRALAKKLTARNGLQVKKELLALCG